MAKSRRKKRKSKKIRKKSRLFSVKKILFVLLACFSAFAIVYAVNHFSSIEEEKVDEKSTEILMNKMKKMLDDEKKRLEAPTIQKSLKEPKKLPPIVSVKQDSKKSIIKQDKKRKELLSYEKRVDTIHPSKPRLAIVIDDVAFAHQTRLIKKIPFRITPSFFPPSKNYPNTVELSKDFNFAMVHLPVEAFNHKRPEPQTLRVGDTADVIRDRVREVKKWFPHISYYNSHTGSKFTSDYKSMDKLIKILKDENIYFLDSRTIANTKAPKVAKKHGLKLYTRDVFLDNSTQKRLIREQLKKAVDIAKKRGYAVAIGHPHKNTLSVLMNAQDLLEGVEVVYLKDLK